MGKNVSIIAEHAIEYKNPMQLIEILSSKLNYNIKFGFVSYIDLNEHLPILDLGEIITGYEVNHYLIHEHIIDKSFPTAILINDNYLYTWLYEKYGEKAGAHPEFKKHWGSDEILNLRVINDFMNDAIIYNFYSKNLDFQIYHQSLGYYYPHSNWNYFNDYILGINTWWLDKEELIKTLNIVKNLSQKLGGNSAYYVCDQSSILNGIGEGEEWPMDWVTIVASLNESQGEENIINIRKCLIDKNYQKIQSDKVQNSKLIYSVYFDDFSD